jgi:hypothetical protein
MWENTATSWTLPIPGCSKETNLFMMLGYARGDYLMAKMTPLLMIGTMMTSATFEADVPTGNDEAKGDDSAGRRTSSARTQGEP